MISRLVLRFGLALLSATALIHPAQAGDAAALQIIVSKDLQSLTVYDGDQIVASSNISTGKSGHSTPSGIFSILEKKKYHESNLYSNAPMPFMQRITWSGVALHESGHVPNYPASHGCVRMPKAFAKMLYQMTERGGHVIITDAAVAPVVFQHPALFVPRIAVEDGQLLSDAQLRPTSPDAVIKPFEVAMNDVSKPDTPAMVQDLPPLRILITRRGPRETLMDAQALLTTLGFDAGMPDGHAGAMTVAAINGFKRWKNLSTKGVLITPDFLSALYQASGRGEPPAGQILVRQKFQTVIEAPVTIRDPEVALGTHLIEASNVQRNIGTARWVALTLDNYLPTSTMKRFGIITPADPTAFNATAAVLDRITIPDDIRRKIEVMLSEGSSISISDTGLGPETGDGTDFITLTKSTPLSKKG